MQASLPRLQRSALLRCLKRHGMSWLPEIEGNKPRGKTFKRNPIGYVHVDIAEARTEEGKRCLFGAMDCTSKFADAELHPSALKSVVA
jgi:hypothetical protein